MVHLGAWPGLMICVAMLWQEQLAKHLADSHQRYFCDLCVTHRTQAHSIPLLRSCGAYYHAPVQVFIAEHPLYTKAQLKQHRQAAPSLVSSLVSSLAQLYSLSTQILSSDREQFMSGVPFACPHAHGHPFTTCPPHAPSTLVDILWSQICSLLHQRT